MSNESAKPKKLKKILLIIAAVCLVLVAAEAWLILHYLNLINYEKESDVQPAIVPEEALPNADDVGKHPMILEYEQYLEANKKEDINVDYAFPDNVFNVLLIGLDNRSAGNVDRGRTDSMIVVSVNRSTKKIVLTSLMRDSYVQIPGIGNDRLNSAYVYGGAQLLFDTIEQNYKIPLSNYALVDFFSFIDAVDAIGGIDLEITEAEAYYINDFINVEYYELAGDLGIDVAANMLPAGTSGLTHLNGLQALSYARNRSIGADYGRTERQRKVIVAALEKMKYMDLSQLNDLAEIVLPSITTNMSRSDILGLLSHAPEYLNYDKISLRLPTNETMWEAMINEMSVICANYKANFDYWYAEVYGPEAEN